MAILSIKDQIELTLFARTVDFRLSLLSKMHKVAIELAKTGCWLSSHENVCLFLKNNWKQTVLKTHLIQFKKQACYVFVRTLLSEILVAVDTKVNDWRKG